MSFESEETVDKICEQQFHQIDDNKVSPSRELTLSVCLSDGHSQPFVLVYRNSVSRISIIMSVLT